MMIAFLDASSHSQARASGGLYIPAAFIFRVIRTNITLYNIPCALTVYNKASQARR